LEDNDADVRDYFDYENKPDKGYDFSYGRSDGAYRSETGSFIRIDDEEFFEVIGAYGFIDPDGKQHRYSYEAGVNGYIVSKLMKSEVMFKAGFKEMGRFLPNV